MKTSESTNWPREWLLFGAEEEEEAEEEKKYEREEAGVQTQEAAAAVVQAGSSTARLSLCFYHFCLFVLLFIVNCRTRQHVTLSFLPSWFLYNSPGSSRTLLVPPGLPRFLQDSPGSFKILQTSSMILQISSELPKLLHDSPGSFMIL